MEIWQGIPEKYLIDQIDTPEVIEDKPKAARPLRQSMVGRLVASVKEISDHFATHLGLNVSSSIDSDQNTNQTVSVLIEEEISSATQEISDHFADHMEIKTDQKADSSEDNQVKRVDICDVFMGHLWM